MPRNGDAEHKSVKVEEVGGDDTCGLSSFTFETKSDLVPARRIELPIMEEQRVVGYVEHCIFSVEWASDSREQES